ncbi:hypothetical protein [Gramella sp. AN32]|uniref:Prenyltransferase n=1 Tax=Christiangramia antarctica TaxID=2058158 RepID=A0ABW5X6G2_9FLAO|nr:hypothetical protein [Gramella sp. AN32]MCM4157487.1 hypothetical protein [Gramella sp. AN32]
MKFIKNVFDLYITCSIHVSIAIIAFTFITYLQFSLPLNKNLILFIFFASITGYNFVKYAGVAKLHHMRLTKNLRLIQLFSLGCFLAMCYLAFQLNKEVLISTAILGLFTLLYAVPFLGRSGNLRSLPTIKVFIIALVWAGTTFLLPLIDAGNILGTEILIDFFQRFLFVLVLILPFEIRDLQFDKEDLATIPQLLGVLQTKIFGTFLLFIIFFIELFQRSIENREFIVLSMVLLIAGIFLWNAKREQSIYYTSFWVEAIPIFYLILELIFRDFL